MGYGTHNLANQSAMQETCVEKGIQLGKEITFNTIDQGCNLILLGEMGIGNTTCASAILSALTHYSPERCAGRGTGINDEQLARKVRAITNGIARINNDSLITILAQVGGFEIVQLVGSCLAAYERKVAIVIDGFIVSVAALVATKLQPGCRDYMIFSHHSKEQAHALALSEMSATPLLSLSLRLGEGTGAVLALPLMQAAAAFYNNMATFEQAGIDV